MNTSVSLVLLVVALDLSVLSLRIKSLTSDFFGFTSNPV